MPKTVIGLLDSHDEASVVVQELVDHGFRTHYTTLASRGAAYDRWARGVSLQL